MFFFKQKTAYEMRISDWSSDVCSSDLGESLHEKKVTVQILEEIDAQIQRYLLIQLGTSALVGVGTGLLFAINGLDNAVFWGVAAAEIGRASCRERVCQYV